MLNKNLNYTHKIKRTGVKTNAAADNAAADNAAADNAAADNAAKTKMVAGNKGAAVAFSSAGNFDTEVAAAVTTCRGDINYSGIITQAMDNQETFRLAAPDSGLLPIKKNKRRTIISKASKTVSKSSKTFFSNNLKTSVGFLTEEQKAVLESSSVKGGTQFSGGGGGGAGGGLELSEVGVEEDVFSLKPFVSKLKTKKATQFLVHKVQPAAAVTALGGPRAAVLISTNIKASLTADMLSKGSAALEEEEVVVNAAAVHNTQAVYSDQDLAMQAAKGDPAAFEMLLVKHRSRIYAICFRMLKNKAEAEDLQQEVCLQLFRKIGAFRGDSAFTTWLHRLTVNQVLMYFRKTTIKHERRAASFEECLEKNGVVEGVLDNIALNRDPFKTNMVDRIALEQALAQLPKGCRKVFILHDVGGFDHEEIGRILNCAAGTSKSQLHKARYKLRAILNVNTCG